MKNKGWLMHKVWQEGGLNHTENQGMWKQEQKQNLLRFPNTSYFAVLTFMVGQYVRPVA